MKKPSVLVRLLAGSALLASLVVFVPKFIAQPGPSSQQPTAQQPAQPGGQDQQQAQTFTGKIAKSKGSYVLSDEANKVSYKLDDQDKAKQFEGKNVKVTGTLDASSNTIHVSDIQPASS
jgi:lipopolysaccharide export system protein LptA